MDKTDAQPVTTNAALSARINALRGLQSALNERVEKGDISNLGGAIAFVDLWVETTAEIMDQMLGEQDSP